MNLRQLLRNVSTQWLGIVIQAVVAFALTPYQIKKLGVAGNGVITIINSYVGYSGLLSLGLGSAIVKYVAEHYARKDWHELNETASTIFALYLAIGGLCLALGCALLGPLPSLANIPPELASQARVLLAMMSLALFVQFPGSVYSGALMGIERFDVMNTYVLGLLVFRTLGVVAVLTFAPSIVLVGAVNMSCFVLEQLCAWLWARKLLPEMTISIGLFRRSRVRKVFSFSSQAFLFQVAERLINATDSLVITQHLGPSAVTHYNNGLTLVDKARELVEKAAIVLMPGVSAAAARGETDKLRALWRTGNKAALTLAMPIALVLIVWGRDVVTLWMGDGPPDHLAREATLPMAYLAAAFVMQTAGRAIAKPMFEGWGKLRMPAIVTICEGATNLVLSIAFVRTSFGLEAIPGIPGIAGVAFATLFPATLTGVFVLPFLACRELGVSYPKHVINTLIRALPPLLPAYGVLWLGHRYGMHLHLATLALACLTVLVVYVLFALLLTFDRDERAGLLGPVLRRLGRA